MLFTIEGVDRSGKDTLLKYIKDILNADVVHDIAPYVRKNLHNRKIVDAISEVHLDCLRNLGSLDKNFICVRGPISSIVYGRFFNETSLERKSFDVLEELKSYNKISIIKVLADKNVLEKRWAETEKHYSIDDLNKILNIYNDVFSDLTLNRNFVITEMRIIDENICK